jgi:hypothetical protein
VGTDIYLWVDVEQDDGTRRVVADEVWLAAQAADSDADDYGNDVTWDFKRNYYEFALLGSNRNVGPFEPIVPVRDLPADLPLEVVNDLHGVVNPSWCTAAELLALDWNQRIPHQTAGAWYDDVRQLYQAMMIDDVAGYLAAVEQNNGVELRTWRGRPCSMGEAYPVGHRNAEHQLEPHLFHLPLSASAPGLFELMHKMVRLCPDAPERVRATYAFDSMAGRPVVLRPARPSTPPTA